MVMDFKKSLKYMVANDLRIFAGMEITLFFKALASTVIGKKNVTQIQQWRCNCEWVGGAENRQDEISRSTRAEIEVTGFIDKKVKNFIVHPVDSVDIISGI